MTTAHSPIERLQEQADHMVRLLKLAEASGDAGASHPDKLAEARKRPTITFGVAMDDKILKITMSWETIRDTEPDALAAMIVKLMQEKSDAAS